MQNPTLTGSDCRKFLKAMREFGYPNLTLNEVEDLAERIGNGEDVSGNVIGVLMERAIADALEEQQKTSSVR
jgi:hypothetical protein